MTGFSLVAALGILGSLCGTGGAVPIPAPPPPVPPIQGVKPVAGVPAPKTEDLVPITGPLLDRWSIAVEKYLAMPEGEKLQLQRDLTLGERGRLRRLELIRRIAPESWQKFVTEKGWLTEDGLALVERYEARLRKNGPVPVPVNLTVQRKDGVKLTEQDYRRSKAMLARLFDGLGEADKAKLGSEVVYDVRFRNEQIHSATISNPKTGWTLEVGHLGTDGRSALIRPSPYASVTKKWESRPDAWIDYRVHAQVGYVDLKARFFSDEGDPRIDRLVQLGRRLGVPEDSLRTMTEHATYDDLYKTRGIIMTSLLAEIGRAYNLFGPVDFSWAITSLTKTTHLAPNQQFDESAGFRIRLGEDGPYLGIFGGASQNISPIGSELLREALIRERVEAGLFVENAPHAAVALWGRVPGVSDLEFSVKGSQRWNQNTTASEIEGALITMFQNRPLALRAGFSDENGPDIEFRRRKMRAQLEYAFTDSTRAYLGYERDRVEYGNAEVDSEAIIAGMEMTLGPARRLTADHVFGGRRENAPPLRSAMEPALTELNRALADTLWIADRVEGALSEIHAGAGDARVWTRLDGLSWALSRLDSTARTQILGELNRRALTLAQRRYLSDLLLRTAPKNRARTSEIIDDIRRTIGQGPFNFNTERFWLLDGVVGGLAELLGPGGATDERLDDLRAFVYDLETRIGNGGPKDLTALAGEGISLIEHLSRTSISREDRDRILELVGNYDKDLVALLADGERTRHDAERILEGIGDGLAFYREHRGEIVELIGLLSDPTLYEGAVIAAGRAALLKAVDDIDIPVGGTGLSIKVDAPVVLAASHILGNRLSPVSPVRKGDVEPWLLEAAGRSLGIEGAATEEQIVGGLFDLARDELKSHLTRKFSEDLDAVLTDRARLVDTILGAIPGAAVSEFQARYGVDLAGILPPPGTPPAEVRRFILEKLPDAVLAVLEDELGDEIARGVAELASWAGDIVRREINRTMIHLLLASEELNRLGVDKGRKAADLSVRMMMSSFSNLDARKRETARTELRHFARALKDEVDREEDRLAEKFTRYGKARLEALQLDPRWPRGLKIVVTEEDWAPLLTSYGDKEFFALIERLKERYLAVRKDRPAVIELDYLSYAGSSEIRPNKRGVRFVLPPLEPGENPAFRLGHLHTYLE